MMDFLFGLLLSVFAVLVIIFAVSLLSLGVRK